MTDQEINIACAKKMKLPIAVIVPGDQNITCHIQNHERLTYTYDPLVDNGQCMELVKSFPIETLYAMTAWITSSANVPELVERALTMNRVVCEIVANLKE